MKYNVTLLLRGAAGTIEAPSNTNPIASPSLRSLLYNVINSLIDNDLVHTVGVRVEPAEEKK